MIDTEIKYIDLFAGIGGFRYSFDKAGFKCVFSSKINEPCQKVYKELDQIQNIYREYIDNQTEYTLQMEYTQLCHHKKLQEDFGFIFQKKTLFVS